MNELSNHTFVAYHTPTNKGGKTKTQNLADAPLSPFPKNIFNVLDAVNYTFTNNNYSIVNSCDTFHIFMEAYRNSCDTFHIFMEAYRNSCDTFHIFMEAYRNSCDTFHIFMKVYRNSCDTFHIFMEVYRNNCDTLTIYFKKCAAFINNLSTIFKPINNIYFNEILILNK